MWCANINQCMGLSVAVYSGTVFYDTQEKPKLHNTTHQDTERIGSEKRQQRYGTAHNRPQYLHKYSFHKKLSLRLASNYSRCLLNKPLHISKADTKIFIGGFQAKMRGAGFIPFLGWNTIKTPDQRPFIHLYLAMHSAILWYGKRFYCISYDCSRYLC